MLPHNYTDDELIRYAPDDPHTQELAKRFGEQTEHYQAIYNVLDEYDCLDAETLRTALEEIHKHCTEKAA